MSDIFSREDFLAQTKRRFKTVALPGGKSCRIRSLTAGEWATIDSGNYNKKKGGLSPEGMRQSDLRLFAACVCDANGERLFQDVDIPQIEAIDNAIVVQVLRDAREFCGLKPDLEDAEKNFASTTTAVLPGSSSAPPGPQPGTA